MDHTWPCVLLWLNTLIYCGHSQGIPAAVLTLQPNWPQIFMGESVTMICNIQEGDVTDWTYTWRRTFNNGYNDFYSMENKHQINATDMSVSGEYTCHCIYIHDHKYSVQSNTVKLTVTALPTASVSVSPHGLLYSGETVTLQCDISDYTDWTYRWYQNNQPLPNQTSKTFRYIIPIIKTGQTDLYRCEGMRTERPQRSQPSNDLSISVTVTGSSTSVLVGVVVGLVVAVVLLTIFLVLLCRYKKSKGSSSNLIFWPVHPQSTNQDPQQDQGYTQVTQGYTELTLPPKSESAYSLLKPFKDYSP